MVIKSTKFFNSFLKTKITQTAETEENKNGENGFHVVKNNNEINSLYPFIKSLIRNYPDILFLVDTKGKIINYFADSDHNLYTVPDSFINKNLKEVLPYDVGDLLFKAIYKVAATKRITVVEYSLPINNINKVFEARLLPPVEGKIVIITKEITSLKRAEEALKISELRFRSVWESSTDGLRLVDQFGRIIAVNEAYCSLVGIPLEELLGQPYTVVYNDNTPQHIDHLLDEFKDLFEDRKIRTNFEAKVTLSSGKNLYLEVSNSFVNSYEDDLQGNDVLLLSIFKDISERKNAEELLKKSELQFRTIWERTNDGMRLTDSNGIVIAVNNAFCEMSGFSEHEIVGRHFYKLYLNNNPSFFKHEHSTVFESGCEEMKQSKLTFINNRTYIFDISYRPIQFNENEKYLLGIFHDITMRKKAEENLRNNEKLVAIGKMSAYLSHEIKTPIASIKLNMEMIQKDLELPKNKLKSFNIIQKEVKRLDKLLKNVLQFSRQSEILPVQINLKNIIENITQLFYPQLVVKDVKIINGLDDITISGDYQKLHTLFNHLIENSLEAIEGSGVIQIYSEVVNNNTLNVYLKDSGSGIPSTVKLFEPFITTKNNGTGLGLSISQKIMEQHSGSIELFSSEPGETIFKLTFNL